MTRKKPAVKKWSKKATEESHALKLEENVFTWKDPKKIAKSLRKSADASKSRKSSPYRAAISMLTFYINRAGKHLDRDQKAVLEKTKDELRKLYDKK